MAASTRNVEASNGDHDLIGNGKKHILLNAFDMSTIGHLSPGQWKVYMDLVIFNFESDCSPGRIISESQRQISYETQPRILDRTRQIA